MPRENPDSCGFDKCILCRSCDAVWVEAIAQNRKVFHYEKGQPIFTEGKAIHGLYFIYNGAVKIHQRWAPGNEFILRFAVAGDVLGHRAQGAGSASPVSATTLERTTVCYLDHAFLEAVSNANPLFVRMMMQLYATELQKAEKRMRALATMPVKSRVAEALFVLRHVFGEDAEGYCRIPVTRIDIASYAGTTYEAVFRLLIAWTREGLVTTAGKKIRIDEKEKLTALIQPSTL